MIVDCALYEDGVRQTITHFSKETDAPLTILLLLDTSGSVRDKLKYEQEAAVEFLSATLRRGRDKAACRKAADAAIKAFDIQEIVVWEFEPGEVSREKRRAVLAFLAKGRSGLRGVLTCR